jgi:Na+/proline symporter
LVGEASVISLVGLFVPLCAGMFFKNRNERAAVGSMLLGTAVWLYCNIIETEIPSLIYGLIAAIISMVVISVLLPRKGPANDTLHH